MRQKYWINCWNSEINHGDYITLGEEDFRYMSTDFLGFVWNLLKACCKYKHIQIDIMVR